MTARPAGEEEAGSIGSVGEAGIRALGATAGLRDLPGCLCPPPHSSSASKRSNRLEVAASRWIASAVCGLSAAKIRSSLSAWPGQGALVSVDRSKVA